MTSILEGPRFPVVLFFCIFGNFRIGVIATGVVVVIGVVTAVTGNDAALERASVVVLTNTGVVFWEAVVSGTLEVSELVDRTV